jgi:hypothetical protein
MLKTGLIVVLVAFMSSCETWIDPEINVDPVNPADVPITLLIPTIQLDLGFMQMGNPCARPTNIWMQIYDGVARQSFTQGRYQFTAADVNNLWGSIYTEQLMNAKIIIQKAEEQESPHNLGVGKVLMAVSLGITTDMWGDVPYSDALKGMDNVLKAEFDTQQEVYDSIFSLLDQAVTNLNAAEDPIGINGDTWYDGDPDAWINAARAIKARHTLQLSKKNDNAAYTAALALTDAFSSNADNIEARFTAANQNPLFQFMEQRSGDLVMCATLLAELQANDDPRIPFYYAEDGNGEYTGSIPGSENDAASLPGPYLAGQAASTWLMTYSELKFIEAECALQTGDASRAATAFNEGVLASCEQVTGAALDPATADSVFIQEVASETGGSITLEKIMMEKRHALVGQPQVWSDWRRTGIPSLTMVPGAFLSAIPQRFPYAQDETIYNEDNIPPVADITVKVWWATE